MTKPRLDYLLKAVGVLLMVSLAGLGAVSACAADVEAARPGRLIVPEAVPGPSQGAAAVEPVASPSLSSQDAMDPPAAAPAEPTLTSSVSNQPVAAVPLPIEEPIIVYITRTGSKYHRGSCQHLRGSKIPMDIEEARMVLAPCGTCKPPR